ncbi:hypothetical protein CCACVL1_19881 [Corchorus capsularis]|uniref:Uncharacterized protein n=1 Tax=Corchorus capsularis TaxID=210143 RepID=A0A1R3HE86_COCAP|nr:hypothetical protein CCACVL1_19881 [Corchorus capsularis]
MGVPDGSTILRGCIEGKEEIRLISSPTRHNGWNVMASNITKMAAIVCHIRKGQYGGPRRSYNMLFMHSGAASSVVIPQKQLDTKPPEGESSMFASDTVNIDGY